MDQLIWVIFDPVHVGVGMGHTGLPIPTHLPRLNSHSLAILILSPLLFSICPQSSLHLVHYSAREHSNAAAAPLSLAIIRRLEHLFLFSSRHSPLICCPLQLIITPRLSLAATRLIGVPPGQPPTVRSPCCLHLCSVRSPCCLHLCSSAHLSSQEIFFISVFVFDYREHSPKPTTQEQHPRVDRLYTDLTSMAWRQIVNNTREISFSANPGFFRFFSSKSSAPYAVKVGIPEFLNGIGKGVETHVGKLESEIGDIHKLLVTRTLKLKKMGIPCKHRKLILKYTHKYRLGLWRPRAESVKA